jgi:aconitate decarboxylase
MHAASAEAQHVDGSTRELARFLVGTTYKDIPEEVLTRTKHLILDGVGCGLLAARLDWSARAVKTLQALDGAGAATVWGWDLRVPPMTAALLNGTFIQGFELDDYHPFGPLHSQACVLPAVLGTAEHKGGVSGRSTLEAVVLGFEVGPRIGMAMGGLQLVNRGWHCGAIYGVLGAVAGAGKVHGLDEAQFEDAIGIAATQACGLMSAQFEAMVKRMHSGMAARSGVLGAALAEAGFTGIKQVLERDYAGFASTFCGQDPFDLSRLTNGLGVDWEVMRIAVKPPYSCMAGIHSAIEGALQIRERPGFEATSIEHIDIGVTEAMKHHGGWKLERPATVMGAQMNHAYAVAVTLLDGMPTVPQFAPQRINQEDVWELVNRIDVHHDPEIDARGEGGRWGTRLRVRLKGGDTFEVGVTHPKGGHIRPFTNEEIVTKFDLLAGLVTLRDRAEELKRMVLNLEAIEDVTELARALGTKVEAPYPQQ